MTCSPSSASAERADTRSLVSAPTAAAVAALSLTAPTLAVVALPSQFVGPPRILLWQDGERSCPVSVAMPNGQTIGRSIPFPALRLGSPVQRAKLSFTTGGGMTSRLSWEAKQQRAGLPYKPEIFDPSSPTLPSIFAEERFAGTPGLFYQRLPIKAADPASPSFGLVHAFATSATRGAITSLELIMPTRPMAAPRYRLTLGLKTVGERCSKQPSTFDVYAPAMSSAEVARLFRHADCNWWDLAACRSRAQWPRGQVLFVLSLPDGRGYQHRWVDYHMLADQQFGRARGKSPARR